MRSRFFFSAALLAMAAAPALAQAPPAQQENIRGTIAAYHGQVLTIKAHDGALETITLAPNFVVRTLVRKKLSDIHPGDFVGSSAVPGADGKLHAVEVHFFPANAPIPDRQFPWDLRPGSLMTNAHVIGLAKAAAGQLLSVDYKNGTAQIIVEPTTPIVAPAPKPGTPQDLTRGKSVFLIAAKAADGTLTAKSVTVEKGGIKPPM
jgi:hypothetical protein